MRKHRRRYIRKIELFKTVSGINATFHEEFYEVPNIVELDVTESLLSNNIKHFNGEFVYCQATKEWVSINDAKGSISDKAYKVNSDYEHFSVSPRSFRKPKGMRD